MNRYMAGLMDARDLARKAREMREAIKSTVRRNGGELRAGDHTLYLREVRVKGHKVSPHWRTILSKRD